jgi:hypothetical protein
MARSMEAIGLATACPDRSPAMISLISVWVMRSNRSQMPGRPFRLLEGGAGREAIVVLGWRPHGAGQVEMISSSRCGTLTRLAQQVAWPGRGVATAFCPEPFTISDVRKVYETVWGSSSTRATSVARSPAPTGFWKPQGNGGSRSRAVPPPSTAAAPPTFCTRRCCARGTLPASTRPHLPSAEGLTKIK